VTEGVLKTKNIHKLMAITFLSHTPCGLVLVVNHKDHNKFNNSVSNLEIVSNRDNTNKKHLLKNGNCTGVNEVIRNSGVKFVSQIYHNGKREFLGVFDTKTEASKAYNEKYDSYADR